MKLFTKSRYGTRLMPDMGQHYDQGPHNPGEHCQTPGHFLEVSGKIIIPLKKAQYMKSGRGPKGGHILAKPPQEITVAEIVALMEEGANFVACSDNSQVCERSETCPTRYLWREAARAMFAKLQSITRADLMNLGQTAHKGKELK